jgi:deoxyribodipyrimidine photo-lyase
MAIHWHRRDLRVADNVGLARADGEVRPVFVFDPAVLEHASPVRVAFMLDALESLRADYRELGTDLLVERGDPAEVLPSLAAEHGDDSVGWNRDYSGLAKSRDRRVETALDDAGVDHEDYGDALLFEPGAITTNAGEYYSVFTYFGRKWLDREKADPVPVPDPGVFGPDPGDGDPLPTRSELGFEAPEADPEPAGTAQARDRLRSFCEADVFEYDELRDYPAEECTSRLSAHLAWGTIGVREVYEASAGAMERAESDAERESVEEFQSQLAWREFYAHVLDENPAVVSENYKSYENDIEWRDDPEELQAWKDGETGYPIVDAGMRQLRAEGYMHNRVRMIVASFLTKDLLIDWREGYDWFRKKLVDHDTANDNGGWQWAASTGTDAQPYFRIFNPTTQGERYDPDAEYVAEYVPELRGVDPDVVHSWPELGSRERDRHAPDYPDPIVDHGKRREQALSMFEAARGDDEEE